MPNSKQTRDWPGQQLRGPDDAKLGSIDQIFTDRTTDEATFAVVKSGLFGTKATLVPIGAASASDGKVHVRFTKSQVKDAPEVTDPERMTVSDAQKLFTHYGLDHDGHEHGADA